MIRYPLKTDFLCPSEDPKDLAISRAIDLAVDAIADRNWKEADRYIDLAYEFAQSDPLYFDPQGD